MINKWSWEHSNGTATDAETIASYNALTTYVAEKDWYGSTGDFYATVWNDLVNKVKEVVDAAPIAWSSSHRSYSNTLMTTDKDLYAEAFNALVDNSGYREYYWAKEETERGYTGTLYFSVGDIVYAKYFITLTDILNAIIETINTGNFFKAELDLLVSIVSTLTTIIVTSLGQTNVVLATNIVVSGKAENVVRLLAQMLSTLSMSAEGDIGNAMSLVMYLASTASFASAMEVLNKGELPNTTIDLTSLFTASNVESIPTNTPFTSTTIYSSTITADNVESIKTNTPFSLSFTSTTSIIATLTEGMQRLNLNCSSIDFTLTVQGNMSKIGTGDYFTSSLQVTQSGSRKAYRPDASTCEYPVPQYPIGRLPTGYTELEYINATGSQYIATGFYPNQNTSVECDFMFTQSLMPNVPFWASSGTNWDNKSYGLYVRISTVVACSCYNDNNVISWTPSLNVRYVASEEKNKLYINDTLKYTHNTSTFQSSGQLFIAGVIDITSPWRYFKGNMYYFKIWDNDTLVRNYIPAKRDSDSKAGMFDLVNNVFYPSSGSGDFIAGPVIESYSYKITYIPQSFNYSITEGVLTID